MPGPNYLSAARLQELKDELKELKTVGIPRIAQQIDDAKQNGDLSENAEYSDAKERMAFAHGRVAVIEHILSDTIIVEEKFAGSEVHVGSTIVVETSGEKRTYSIVGSNEADPLSGKISNESPLGESFLGHRVGDVVEVVTPIKTTSFKILEIK